MSIKDRFGSGGRNRLRESLGRRETIDGILFSLPYLAFFCLFLLYPLLQGLYMSLFEWDPLFPSESQFVGLGNYAAMFGDPAFWNALSNTVYFVVLTVPTMVVLSLALALGVNRKVFGRRYLRTIYFSPYILTVSIVGIVWSLFLATGFGPVNYYLGFVMDSPPDWLGSPRLAMPILAVVTDWWLLGFNFVILLAARQNVPERLYEAAKLDGAGTWRAFRDITLPQMRNAIAFVIIIQFIQQFQVFGQPYVMTNGGPNESTTTLVFYLYNAAFSQQRFGYAAAIGYLLFAILVGVSYVNYRYIGSDSA
ncbi:MULTISPECIES: sugar ABC transporter permease [unclassified Haladaptatus]|uniref:carbohydrate ABC transporter permease n=1 Tax=unclassified Haladaptatus TaxID=2622732 RepID=UPI00209BF3AD|nr:MULTISPECIES: sugar ABC transporter permease [unclassified Haladaptatus]MCO8243393.1 sugar ABC transporter permease [Haladaptatus sp. AB643]MCO8254800.1 sugar ABC transporter permease [Haladaptatus sp. AB618]